MTNNGITTVFAHSKSNTPRSHWHPLENHLKDTAKKAQEFAASIRSGDWAYNAGLLHDLGKYDSAFQGYLLRCNDLDDTGYDSGRINHSSAGATFAEDRLKPFGRILAYLVAGHHAGLPDWHTAETGKAALEARLEEGRRNLKRISIYADEISANLLPMSRPAFVDPNNFHFWVRILFSCLVDADCLDTEQFREETRATERSNFPELIKLAPLLFAALDQMERNAVKSRVNVIRAEVRRACELKADSPKGIFSLTVPTGGGKTLSAMAFATRHAQINGQKRIIYVIPYTSIIEQTGRTLKDIFGQENVIEHHSNINPETETLRSQLASENWDAPIIVTTNVQFFESLFAARSGRCRKLHNIVNSVVILDEAQLLPPKLLLPCVTAMNELVRNYGVSIVLSTATQPSPPKIDSVTEIIPQDLNLYDRLKRTNITIPSSINDPTSWQSLADQLKQYSQVLCIVNTRHDCYDLFNLMPEGTIHLSALMCGAHRLKVIQRIRKSLHDNIPIRVISTQLVEAGVDIDFPVVYRALAGLDSIAQSAGRCNREGKLNEKGKMGEVCVFVPPKPSPYGLLRKGEDTTKEIIGLEINPENPEAFTRYFQLFYSRINDMGSQFPDLLQKDVNPHFFVQFRTAAEQFKLIDDQFQRPVIVRYEGSRDWIEKLRYIGPTREIMRNLQRYTVNIPVRLAEAMLADGRLEEMSSGILVQSGFKIYDDKIGLAAFIEQLPVEDFYIK